MRSIFSPLVFEVGDIFTAQCKEPRYLLAMPISTYLWMSMNKGTTIDQVWIWRDRDAELQIPFGDPFLQRSLLK